LRCDLLYESTMDIVEATSEKGFEGAGVLNGWQDEDSRRIGPRPSERLASFTKWKQYIYEEHCEPVENELPLSTHSTGIHISRLRARS